MDRRAAITYGVTGQSLELYPPEWVAGVPSVATFSVWEGTDGDDQAAEFTGSGTVDSVSTTLDAAAGTAQHAATGGRRRIPLTATTSIVKGRDYLVENAVGQRERVRVAAIASADYVEVESELAYDYAIGATFKGIRITVAIDATFVATEAKINRPENPYRVLWTYTVDGVVRKTWTAFDLVRAAKKHGITVEAFLGEWPTILYQLGRDERGNAARDAIKSGWERVLFDLEMAGIDPNALRDGGKLDMLVKAATLKVFGDRREGPPGADMEQWAKERAAIYRSDFEKAVAGNRLLVSEGTEGNITTDPVRPGWFVS